MLLTGICFVNENVSFVMTTTRGGAAVAVASPVNYARHSFACVKFVCALMDRAQREDTKTHLSPADSSVHLI